MTYFGDIDNPATYDKPKNVAKYDEPDYPSKYLGYSYYGLNPNYYTGTGGQQYYADGTRRFPDDGGFGGGGGKSETKYKPDYGDYSDAAMDTVGYETDWKYPNWLIRMGQWRNF